MPFTRPKPACDVNAAAPVAAGIVFVAKDGDVLLLRRAADEKNYGGHWGLPGGKGDAGETAVDAAIRETREEMQYELEAEAHGLKVMDRVDTPNGMQFTTFAKGVDDKFVPTLDGEHSGYCWASLDQLPQPLHPSVAKCLGVHIGSGASDQMSPEAWGGIKDGLANWVREPAEDGQIEIPHQEHIVRPKDFFAGMPGRGAADQRLAMDRRLYDARGKRIMGHDVMALDRAPSSRVYDADGHLHLARTPISKANVCEYWGHEIPDADKLGLDPDRKYKLLRHPDELAKAAASSNGKQLMLGHVPVSADDPQKDVQVGSTGTDAEFDGTYLYNSLHLHDRAGIQAIEDADQATDAEGGDPQGAKELSSAYRYRVDMTPGEFQGTPYDGVMRDIDFNHVALVPEGRAGADVVVGDSQLKEKELPQMKLLSRFAGASAVAVQLYLQPRLAQDAKIDVSPLFDGVTKKNFGTKKAKLAADLKTAAKKLGFAKDANLDDVTEFLDKLEKVDVMEGADEDPNSGLPMTKDELEAKAKDAAEEEEKKKAADKKSARDAFLTGKGMKAEDIAALDELEAKDADPAEKKDDKEEKPDAKDNTPKGMDAAAVSKLVKGEGDRIRSEMRATAQAYADVEPFVGKIALGMDSAADVYRTALKGMGLDAKAVDAMHVDALKPVLLAQPKPGEKNGKTIAADAVIGDSTGFQGRWGKTTDRIGGA